MRILRASDYRRMPWKNGKGETTEIAVSPPDASMADFDWRISMASVTSDGDFSLFEGIDRSLSILVGEGLDLQIEGGAHVRLDRASTPFTFPADRACFARLIDGPVLDLNVMTRRQYWTSRVTRLLVDRAIGIADRQIKLIYVQRGHIERVDDTSILLSAGDAVLFDDPAARKIIGAAAEIFLVEIFPSTFPFRKIRQEAD